MLQTLKTFRELYRVYLKPSAYDTGTHLLRKCSTHEEDARFITPLSRTPGPIATAGVRIDLRPEP